MLKKLFMSGAEFSISSWHKETDMEDDNGKMKTAHGFLH